MKIYTRTGDSGTTGLFGGARVDKDHPRLAAYGTVDEANSFIGVAISVMPTGAETLVRLLEKIQDDMFVVGADLATPLDAKPAVPRITSGHVAALEKAIDGLEDDLAPLASFILPGGSPAGALLHVARTVTRRAERDVVALAKSEAVDTIVIEYLNRLSDLLFVSARWINSVAGVPEVAWKPE
jgi:cob(I)alamin adenosyltransferase